MIYFEIIQTIDRPAEEVFRFLGNLSNMTNWNYYIQSVTKISGGNIGEGTIFEQKRPHDLHQFKITEYQLPHKVVVQLQPPGPDLQYGFTLTPLERSTKVVYHWRLHLEKYKLLKYLPGGTVKRWLLFFADRIIQTRVKPAVGQNFSKLKTLLEAGEVLLQDGRQIVLTSQMM